MSNEKYTLELSKHEFYWLARAWGFTRIPFLSDSLCEFSQNQIEEYQEKAKQSLLERGFITPQKNFGWQIDHIVAGFVYWIATSTRVFAFELFRRNGQSIKANIYVQDNGTSLVMLITNASYELTLFQKPDGHIEQLSAWFNVEETSKTSDSVILPSPLAQNLILDVWNDTSKVKKYVDSSGQKDPFITAWLENVELFASMSVKERRFGKIDTVRKLCALKSENQIWISSNNQLTTFSQVTQEAMKVALNTFFGG